MTHAPLASPKAPVPLLGGMSKRLSNIVVTMAILTAGTARADLIFPTDATNFTSSFAVIETTTNTTVARTLQS